MEAVQRALESALGVEVATMRELSGGDTARAFRVELDDGRRVFAKTHASPPDGFFGREAIDLGWLGETGALPVPSVLALSDGTPAFLALSWIEPGVGVRPDERAFGRELAALHRSAAPSFGRADRRTTGSLALANDPADTWSEFFAERRLLPLARIAHDRSALSNDTVARLERLAARLDAIGGPPERPARLHGDLWAGNRMVDDRGRSWLIDPAAHGGHREFDLAMMRLFGGFGVDAFAAYHEAWPLAEGWEQRILLHQLAPLVVHAVKFGGGYAAAVDSALSKLN